MRDFFRRFSVRTAAAVGSPWSFMISVAIIVAWAVTGPAFKYSDTWQLVINTGTTIITFLMVFLIQNTQNRDAKAIHLKLDELIYHLKGPRNELVNLENCTDEELAAYEEQFKRVRQQRLSDNDEEGAAFESPSQIIGEMRHKKHGNQERKH